MVKHREDSIVEIRKQQQNKDETIRLLQAQLQAATDRQDFLEDCIAEMAAAVYSV